jgi:2-polyprenyl-3-methyl-5-hydroxy-6-metoxy-1,4-benzoquinol methylase
MSEPTRIAGRISSLCGGTWLRHYVSCKLRTDPLYDGVFCELKTSTLPLLDIGCGIGILGMYLRERGWVNSFTGFDYDASKIKGGRELIAKGAYADISLSQGDARRDLPEHSGDVAILDILQFFDNPEKTALLESAAARVAPGGTLVVRSGLFEKSLRFYTTLAGDIIARCTFWMKSAPVHYPTEAFFREVLEAQGLVVEIRPFWGGTPFNNYLILAKRPG